MLTLLTLHTSCEVNSSLSLLTLEKEPEVFYSDLFSRLMTLIGTYHSSCALGMPFLTRVKAFTLTGPCDTACTDVDWDILGAVGVGSRRKKVV